MILFKKIAELGAFIAEQKKKGRIIGFVPTMGALHNGHISLINNSKQLGQLVVSSIFVNPTQFNDAKDFEKYPVTLEKDIDLLEKNGCEVLFLPSVKEMYPDGVANLPHYQLGYLETVLEGKYRPGHFQGVCQVVHRLLHAVQPDQLFLGQKDYQQCMVIKKLIELENLKITVVIGATLREPDGLAMSSRNMRLNNVERNQAVKISETLQFIKKEIRPGYIEDLKDRAVQYLTAEGFKVDYVEIATADTLALVQNWDGKTPLVTLAAAYLNEVRLIDNMLIP
ncbi:pantoate--beta-alanine ligase [Ferruginibacter sp. SUN106]|uniref:pantoate--beta-alanine ligase n=1 Tax=Ferruginibacter sp. SUN106 TaxID=2978348 RepID=UPI003D36FF62